MAQRKELNPTQKVPTKRQHGSSRCRPLYHYSASGELLWWISPPVRRRLDLAFKERLVADNTHVCSCQHGGIIYSIKSPGHADKQTGWMFIYETSRWQDNMAAGGLPVPHDPPVVASFMPDFIGFLFTCFQINCPFELGNPLINR